MLTHNRPTEERQHLPHVPVNWDGSHEDDVIHDDDFEYEEWNLG